MKRSFSIAALLISLSMAALLSAQTSPRMALPTGGLTPPKMNAAPTTGGMPTAAVPTPAEPVLVAAQPTFAPTNIPAETDSLTVPPSAANTAALPEWRFAEKPVLPSSSSPTTRYERTAMQSPESSATNRIRDCLLKASAEVQLPAQEAGVLVELKAFEGQEVQLDQFLGRIDDSQPRLQKKAAEAERAVTIEKGKSTVNDRYSSKASDVAYQEWQKGLESNRNAERSVSQVEIMRLQLTWEKGKLEYERAQEERKIENLTTLAKDVDVEAAEDAIRRRQLIAPISGVVVELTPHVGEWLKPGDPVLKIVNMELLKIEGYVNIKHFRQDQLQNRTVIAEVDMGTKTPLNVPAKITFVSPVVEPGGEYRIKVEIQNRKNPQSGDWILKPGLSAELVLDAAGNP
jgi:macrolide-specific efflux system membrane fusion protein